VTSPLGPVGGEVSVSSLDPRDPQTRQAVLWLGESSGIPAGQVFALLAAEHVQSTIRSEIRAAIARRKERVAA
jgi:hypothetical protein